MDSTPSNHAREREELLKKIKKHITYHEKIENKSRFFNIFEDLTLITRYELFKSEENQTSELGELKYNHSKQSTASRYRKYLRYLTNDNLVTIIQHIDDNGMNGNIIFKAGVFSHIQMGDTPKKPHIKESSADSIKKNEADNDIINHQEGSEKKKDYELKIRITRANTKKFRANETEVEASALKKAQLDDSQSDASESSEKLPKKHNILLKSTCSENIAFAPTDGEKNQTAPIFIPSKKMNFPQRRGTIDLPPSTQMPRKRQSVFLGYKEVDYDAIIKKLRDKYECSLLETIAKSEEVFDPLSIEEFLIVQNNLKDENQRTVKSIENKSLLFLNDCLKEICQIFNVEVREAEKLLHEFSGEYPDVIEYFKSNSREEFKRCVGWDSEEDELLRKCTSKTSLIFELLVRFKGICIIKKRLRYLNISLPFEL